MGRSKKTINIEDTDENREPLMHFKGWLPVDDKVNDVDNDSLRVKLESFIREVLNA